MSVTDKRAVFRDGRSESSMARTGIAFMLVGLLLFSLNDVLGKWLVSTYSVGQVTLIRSGAALVVLLPFVWKSGWRSIVHVERPGMQVLRVVLSATEGYAFYLAVSYMPLADTMTFWLAAPIYVAAASPFLLGEKVGWRRWTAICVGFCGVLIALEPSAATLTLPALVSIYGSCAFAFITISGRALRGTPDVTLVFWHMVGGVLLGLATAPFGWVTPGAIDFSLLALLGIVALVAHVCVNRSLKLGDAATMVPFQYTLLLWAVVFGWLVFGDVPRPRILIGGAIIVCAGLFIFFRQQQLKKKPLPIVTPAD